MGSFTPLVFGLNGGVGNECHRFLKYLAGKIAQKDTELYNTVIAWHRTQFSFEQLRSVHSLYYKINVGTTRVFHNILLLFILLV